MLVCILHVRRRNLEVVEHWHSQTSCTVRNKNLLCLAFLCLALLPANQRERVNEVRWVDGCFNRELFRAPGRRCSFCLVEMVFVSKDPVPIGKVFTLRLGALAQHRPSIVTVLGVVCRLHTIHSSLLIAVLEFSIPCSYGTPLVVVLALLGLSTFP